MSDERLTLGQKISYGCGDLSSNLVWGMTLSFLMYYYTDIYVIPVAAAAWILLVPRVVDAFLDPLIGYLIDRSAGRHVLTLIRRLSIPFGLATVLCFLPIPLSPVGKIAWASCSYLLMGVIYSAINVPYAVLSNMIALEPQERVSVNAFRMGGCQLGQLIVAGVTLPAVEWLGGGGGIAEHQKGMTLLVAILGTVGAILWTMTWKNCRIRRTLPVNTSSFGQLLSGLSGNRRWHLVNALTFLTFLIFCSQGALAIHYTKYILHQPATYASFVLASSTFWAMVGAMGVQLVTRHLGIRRTYIAAVVLQIMMMVAIYAVGGDFIPFLLCVSLLYVGVGAVSPLYFAMLSEAIDSGRERTGVAAAGLAFSINAFLSKVAAGIAGFIVATFLAYGHYQAGLHAADAHLQGWIRLGYIGLPTLSMMLCVVLLVCSRKDAPRTAGNLVLGQPLH